MSTLLVREMIVLPKESCQMNNVHPPVKAFGNDSPSTIPVNKTSVVLEKEDQEDEASGLRLKNEVGVRYDLTCVTDGLISYVLK